MGIFKSKVAVPTHFCVPTSRTNILTEGRFTVAVRYGHKSWKVEVKGGKNYYRFCASLCRWFDLKGDEWELFREEDDRAFPRVPDYIVRDAVENYHGKWKSHLKGPTVRSVGIRPNNRLIIRRVNEDEPNTAQKATQTEFDFPKNIEYKCIHLNVETSTSRGYETVLVPINYYGTCTLDEMVHEIASAFEVRKIHMLRCLYNDILYRANSTETCAEIGLANGSSITVMYGQTGGGGEYVPYFNSESVRVQTIAKAVGSNMTPPPQVNNPPKAKT